MGFLLRYVIERLGEEMELLDFLDLDSTLFSNSIESWHVAVRTMVEAVVPEDDVQRALAAIEKREELGVTAIGRSIAIPHSKLLNLSHMRCCLGVFPNGIERCSDGNLPRDEEPIRVFALILAPSDQPGNHLRVLEAVVEYLKDDDLVQALYSAVSAEEVNGILKESRSRPLAVA